MISKIQIRKIKYEDYNDSTKQFTPKIENEMLSFNLTGSGCRLANALRRSLLNYPVKFIRCRVFTDTNNIPSDSIEKSISMLPIKYNTKLGKLKDIYIENIDNEPLPIYSKDLPGFDFCDPGYHITTLLQNQNLTISDIEIIEERSDYLMSAQYVTYKYIGQVSENLNEYVDHPDFEISFRTINGISSRLFLINVLSDLKTRLENLEFKFIGNDLIIENDNATISQLLAHFILKTDPSSTIFASINEDYGSNIFIKFTNAKNKEELFETSRKNAIKHFESFLKSVQE